METSHHSPSSGFDPSPSQSLRLAARFWEPRRIAYNAVLTAIVLIWIIATWPHFRPAFRMATVPPMVVLALLANVCYSAAYLVDITVQRSSWAAVWTRRRWGLWLAGTLFAVLLENYWIADEIYPFV